MPLKVITLYAPFISLAQWYLKCLISCIPWWTGTACIKAPLKNWYHFSLIKIFYVPHITILPIIVSIYFPIIYSSTLLEYNLFHIVLEVAAGDHSCDLDKLIHAANKKYYEDADFNRVKRFINQIRGEYTLLVYFFHLHWVKSFLSFISFLSWKARIR